MNLAMDQNMGLHIMMKDDRSCLDAAVAEKSGSSGLSWCKLVPMSDVRHRIGEAKSMVNPKI